MPYKLLKTSPRGQTRGASGTDSAPKTGPGPEDVLGRGWLASGGSSSRRERRRNSSSQERGDAPTPCCCGLPTCETSPTFPSFPRHPRREARSLGSGWGAGTACWRARVVFAPTSAWGPRGASQKLAVPFSLHRISLWAPRGSQQTPTGVT